MWNITIGLTIIRRSVMTIETKYNIGDMVWFMRDNIAMSSIVTGIFASRVAKFYLEIDKLGARWMVSVLIFDFTGTELINCLFDACVKLKAEGVI